MITLTIITVCLNNLSGLKLTAESVLRQTATIGQDFNWIVVDGGSSDGSKEYIKSLDRYLYWYCSEPDGGIYEAMNKGTRQANGSFLLFLNSGVALHNENVINNCLKLLSPDVDIVRGGIREVNDCKKHNCDVFPKAHITGEMLFRGNAIYHPATFIKRSLLLETPYDTCYRISADNHFFRKMYLFHSVKDRVADFIVADFDMNGISNTNGLLAEYELKNSWVKLFGERVYDDYMCLVNGKFENSILGRVIFVCERNNSFRKCVNFFLFPFDFIIKIYHCIKCRF